MTGLILLQKNKEIVMAKKSHSVAGKKKKNSVDKGRRLQTYVGREDSAKLDDLILRLRASSESEAIRRMIRFLYVVTTLAAGEMVTLNVNDQKLVVLF